MKALLLLLAFGAAGIGCAKPAPPPRSPRDNKYFTQQTALYDVYRTQRANVVMLGDSITSAVDWNELLGRSGFVNRGIPSDTLDGFLLRLDYVLKLQPKLCVIMGGVNDIFDGVPPDRVFDRYTQLIAQLRERGITPVIQSTLLGSPPWRDTEKRNPQVARLNELLAGYAVREGLDFVDLNKTLSRDGRLRADVTLDGIHLNAAGYALWREALEPVLQKHGL